MDVSSAFVWIFTMVPLFTNRLAISTDCVRKPPGLSRISSTNDVAPCDSRSATAFFTRSAAFCVICLSLM